MKVLSPIKTKQINAGWKLRDLFQKLQTLMIKSDKSYLINASKYSPYLFSSSPKASFSSRR